MINTPVKAVMYKDVMDTPRPRIVDNNNDIILTMWNRFSGLEDAEEVAKRINSFQEIYSALIELIYTAAGEQEDLIELSKVYGEYGARIIEKARNVIEKYKEIDE